MSARTARAAVLLLLAACVTGAWFIRAAAGRWIADDYCFAASSIHDGFWTSQALVYLSASGRYTVAFLYAAITRAGPATSPALAIGGMVAWVAAACVAARFGFRALGAQTNNTETIAAGAGFVAAILNAAPDVYQPLIWMGGLLTYGTPVIAATIIAGAILRRVSLNLPATIAARTALGLAAFVAGGCSEVAATAQLIFCAAMAVVSRRARPHLIPVILGAFIALCVLGVAPGNFRRRALFHPPPIPQAIGAALLHTPGMVWRVAVGGYTLFLPLAVFLALAGADAAAARPRIAWSAAAAATAAMAATLLAAIAGTGRLPWGRMQFVPVAYITAAIVIIGLALRLPAVRRSPIAHALTFVMVVVGVAGLLSNAVSHREAIRDARQFAAAADSVTRRVATGTGRDVVVDAPHTFEYLEFVAADSAHWTNRCIARYYSLASIRSTPRAAQNK